MNNKNIIISISIAIFTLIMFTFSIIDINETEHQMVQDKNRILEHISEMSEKPHSILNDSEHEKVFAYICKELEKNGLKNEESLLEPSYLVQESPCIVSNNGYMGGYLLKNIIAFLPGTSSTKTNDAIIIMAHYDSVVMGVGASDDLGPIAVMLETLRLYQERIANGLKFKNDIVFAFVDGEEFGLLGSEAFMNDFTGFNNLPSRLKFAINLESRGTLGTLIMFETSANNYQTMKLFKETNKTIFTTSIATMIYESMPNGTDFSNLKTVTQGVNFANLGEGENYHTQNDNSSNLKMSYLSQTANIVYDLLENTLNYDLDSLNKSTENGIFFSYFNLTILYSQTVAIILAIVLIILLCLSITLKVIKKKLQGLQMLKSLLLILGSVISSLIIVLILYYLANFIAFLFGVIDFSSIGNITYSNIYLIILVIFITLLVTTLITNLLKKLLKIAKDDIRITYSYLLTLITIILSFILPVASYLFLIPSFLLLILDISYFFIKKDFFQKIPFDLLILALSLPLIMPIVFLATFALGMKMIYIVAAIVAFVLFIFIGNHSEKISYLSGYFSYKKKNLKPLIGTRNLSFILLIALILGIALKPSLSANLLGKQSNFLYYYDDALLLVDDGQNTYLEIKDLNAYSILKTRLEDFSPSENGSEKSYIKEVEYNLNFSKAANINYANQTLEITKNYEDSFLEIDLPSANIKEVIVEYQNGVILTINQFSQDGIKIALHTSAVIKINSEGPYNELISIKEHIINCEELLIFSEFLAIKELANAKYNYTKITTIEA